ncbi:MAG: site-specific integrase [Bacteroidales bacterium]
MAKINFYLKPGTENKVGQKSIVMRITYDGKRTVIFTNQKVHTKYWMKRQYVRPPYQHEPENNHEFINESIQLYRRKAEEAITNSLKKNIPLNDAYIKNWFTNKQNYKNTGNFFDLFDNYIETGKVDKRPNTIKGYTSVLNFFKEFEKDTKHKINLHAIDMNFFDLLKNYAFINREIKDNYFAKIINVLKSFLNWAVERGLSISDTYKKFSAPEKEITIVTLTIDELFKLYNYEFENESFSLARDLFCFQCFTGLRISDLLDLKKEHIVDNKIMRTHFKTKEIETIPLNKFALQILEKYKHIHDHLLPKLSDQKVNEYIKKCCKKAGIVDNFSVVEFSGGKRKEVIKPKYKFITTHVGRKTFITTSLMLDMDRESVKAISGHKREENFKRYVKIAEDHKQKQMDKAWGKL